MLVHRHHGAEELTPKHVGAILILILIFFNTWCASVGVIINND
jgi:hypothetical protein